MTASRAVASRLGAHALWQIDAAGLAVCAALGALWYFAGLQPLSEAAASREVLKAQLADQDERLSAANKVRAAHEKNAARLQEQIDSGSVTLLRLEQLNTRIATLTAIAQAYHLRVDEIRPDSPVVRARYITVPIHLAGAGSYADCARFFHSLRTDLRDLGIAGFDLHAEPEAPDKPPIFAFTLVWYAAPLKK